MILLMSCFVTHQRAHNKHNRLDVFMSTLKSYARIEWKEVYLFVKLDDDLMERQGELLDFISVHFRNVKVHFFGTRLERQQDWRWVIEEVTGKDDLIWFTQNDDHPFIDIDTAVLREGLDLLAADTKPYKSLYLSHWTEVLKLTGKVGRCERIGNYVRFEATLIDAIQIFSADFLRYLFIEVDWQGRSYTRIDTLLRLRSMWGADNGNTDLVLQNVYVPLREFCRKFSGYGHVAMDYVEDLKFTFDIARPDRSSLAVRKTMLAGHQSMWTEHNNFEIPEEWIETSQKLYRGSSTRDGA